MKQIILCIAIFPILIAKAQTQPALQENILPGAWQTGEYVSILKGKRVGVFANQTSVINQTHLVDSLLRLGIQITTIFGPEHGFRGNADAGEKIDTYNDEPTGIQVISLYGSKLKPSAQDLADVDILLFDIQDVGVRFYTYISSLQYLMESAAENNKPLVVLDRPNPNGFYVDGPVLEPAYKSFVGMQPIPVVYGMTIGEYATMLAGEHWFSNKKNQCNLTVIKCKNYTHKKKYILPIAPSPNLAEQGAIYWYPSTCFFEGTVLNEGRGTSHPFQVFGHPSLPDSLYSFKPISTAGAKEPKLKNTTCYGWNLYAAKEPYKTGIQLHWLLNAYKLFPDKKAFFMQPKSGKQEDYFFNKLAGNSKLMQQIIEDKTEDEIRASWQPALNAFKKIRKKYLLYED